jgi:cardiolipin synthase (CMP-forming)
MHWKSIPWTIPNIISMGRIILFPILLLLIITKQYYAFAYLLAFSLITDIVDGYIARRFKLQTKEGAVLDSLADVGSYIAALIGIAVFHLYVYKNYTVIISIFIILYIIRAIIVQIKYNRPSAGLHLYTAKIGGYCQGVFIFTLFVYKFIEPLFIISMLIGIYELLEGIFIILHAKEPQLNAKSIFHYLKKNKLTNEKY